MKKRIELQSQHDATHRMAAFAFGIAREASKLITPPDLREKLRSPVNSNVIFHPRGQHDK
jgi:hypothetical protein